MNKGEKKRDKKPTLKSRKQNCGCQRGGGSTEAVK